MLLRFDSEKVREWLIRRSRELTEMMRTDCSGRAATCCGSDVAVSDSLLAPDRLLPVRLLGVRMGVTLDDGEASRLFGSDGHESLCRRSLETCSRPSDEITLSSSALLASASSCSLQREVSSMLLQRKIIIMDIQNMTNYSAQSLPGLRCVVAAGATDGGLIALEVIEHGV